LPRSWHAGFIGNRGGFLRVGGSGCLFGLAGSGGLIAIAGFGFLVGQAGLPGSLALAGRAEVVAESIKIILDAFPINARDSILVEGVGGVDLGGGGGVMELDAGAALELPALDELLPDYGPALTGLDLGLAVDGFGLDAVVACLDATGAPDATLSPPRAVAPGAG
jgi:hypothetical protein